MPARPLAMHDVHENPRHHAALLPQPQVARAIGLRPGAVNKYLQAASRAMSDARDDTSTLSLVSRVGNFGRDIFGHCRIRQVTPGGSTTGEGSEISETVSNPLKAGVIERPGCLLQILRLFVQLMENGDVNAPHPFALLVKLTPSAFHAFRAYHAVSF